MYEPLGVVIMTLASSHDQKVCCQKKPGVVALGFENPGSKASKLFEKVISKSFFSPLSVRMFGMMTWVIPVIENLGILASVILGLSFQFSLEISFFSRYILMAYPAYLPTHS